jgi:hypothetical protein
MRRLIRFVLALLVVVAVALACAAWFGFRYSYEPGPDNVLSRTRPSPEAYDLWGRSISAQEAAALAKTSEGRRTLSPDNGVVRVDDALLHLGRHAFYKETFHNELFLSDVLGILDGPLQVTEVSRAVLRLHGRPSTNLRVRVPYTVSIGNRTFVKGSYFDTGLDVARGALVPLGMSISISRGRIRAGITCAACHATVEPVSGKVVEGAPNQDLNAGLLLALATNSAAYFMHTDVDPLRAVPLNPHFAVKTSSGAMQPLPDSKALESAVDTALLLWPRGNFDSLTDLQPDPTQNPVSFTWGNHPYGWTGNFTAGPFRGLTAQNNNVHALNSDSLLLADSSPALLGIDKDVFLAILLQNAADLRYRYTPGSGESPSAFFARVRSSGNPSGPGLNQIVLPPTYPQGTLLSPDGTLTSSPGHPFWQQNNAMSAWQDTLVPPRVPLAADRATRDAGRAIFARAGCVSCHSGPFLTNNRVVPSASLGVNSARGLALQKTENNFASQPVIFSFATPVPIPSGARQLPVPVSALDPAQVDLAWAHHQSGGGYKTPSLVGLFWSAPYLHDGGVSVGPDPATELGIPGTVERNQLPDPMNSLRALVDRSLRSQVIAANASSAGLRRMNVQGIGHNFWVDEQAGFTSGEQRALLLYLLTYDPGS